MKKFLSISLLFLFLGITGIFAQDTETKSVKGLDISLDLMSRYIWRGTDFGASPSIQPGVSYTYKGLTLGAWGAFATNLTGIQEGDLFLSYSIKDMVSLTITDYFFPDENKPYNYFDYGDSTAHVFEAGISFDGTDKIPFTFLLATNFYGADARRINDDGTVGKIQFSTYAELTYTYKNLSAFMGVNLTKPNTDKGESGFYGDKIGIVNLGLTATKEVKITDYFNLPISVSLITNPVAKRIYLVAGISL
jgi:hypothetical protein